ncbi:rhomboid family intramembrane serine protease [Candidatus Bathyarchaeota archaeon]|nr:rhomboid family intramembrane serine protease [Candidatus Bathyarchaeota archaeon]
MPRSTKDYMPTYIIIAVSMAAYLYTSILSGNFVEMDYGVVRQYGQYNSFVLNGGYWQLFTSMFVHVNIVHLLGNMIFLLIFGLRAEELFKIEEYLAVYFIPGLAGNLLTLLFGPNMVSAGASGAIFGLFGACTIYVRRAVGQSIFGALIYSFFLLMMSTGPNVNNLAHLGGLAVGLLIGYILARKRRDKIVYSYSHYIG